MNYTLQLSIRRTEISLLCHHCIHPLSMSSHICALGMLPAACYCVKVNTKYERNVGVGGDFFFHL